MITRTMKILSAAVIAAALIGTVAVSRTVQTRAMFDAQPAHDSAAVMAQPAPRSDVACGTLSYVDCKILELTLPQ